ncbi:hypothetical protein PMAYCL1PPCAC_33500, partial [Pristionchus mayeri]
SAISLLLLILPSILSQEKCPSIVGEAECPLNHFCKDNGCYASLTQQQPTSFCNNVVCREGRACRHGMCYPIESLKCNRNVMSGLNQAHSVITSCGPPWQMLQWTLQIRSLHGSVVSPRAIVQEWRLRAGCGDVVCESRRLRTTDGVLGWNLPDDQLRLSGVQLLSDANLQAGILSAESRLCNRSLRSWLLLPARRMREWGGNGLRVRFLPRRDDLRTWKMSDRRLSGRRILSSQSRVSPRAVSSSGWSSVHRGSVHSPTVA